MARRCALIALAGELAIEWGILPWEEGEATTAAGTILGWWLDRRGGTGSTEESQHVRAVRAYLSEFGSSRFVALSWEKLEGSPGRWVECHPDRPILSRTGWRRPTDAGDEYLIDRDGWAKMCASAGADPVEVAKTLTDAGHIKAGTGRNNTKAARLPHVGQIRVYAVQPTIFAEPQVAAASAAA